jgi:hypothetical protein
MRPVVLASADIATRRMGRANVGWKDEAMIARLRAALFCEDG